MARYLAHKESLTQDRLTGDKPTTEGSKGHLTRRECVKLGLATASAGLVAGSGLVGASAGQDEAATTFTTDFSEYTL